MKLSLKHVKTKILLGLFLVFVLTLFIPTPYYLYQPGSAEELAPRVTVENGQKEEKGSLYLTTVLSYKASNIYYLIYGLLAPNTDLRKVQDVRGDLTDEEYDRLLKHMMDSSQQNAIGSSLKEAGEKVDTVHAGVFITNILPTSKAKGSLQVGDIITAVDRHPITQMSDLLEYLSSKKPNETIEVQFIRGEETDTKKIELMSLETETRRAGLGILLENQISLKTDRKVEINASDIGGPSAGLMFSLEIYSQLTPGDLTKGYKIAGTGTIDQEGNVGQIGGIRDKIIAAHDAGINIFFCPKDIHTEDMNEKDVIDEVNKHGYDIKIVPVKTMADAIEYLSHLPQKNK